MEKTISIDGKDVLFKATAATPRVYRQAFGRDIYLDMTSLFEEIANGTELSVSTLESFEDIAFCMYKQAKGEPIKRDTVEEEIESWLEQFDTFSIYRIAPQIIEIWRLNSEQKVTPKNQVAQPNDQ